MKKRKILAIVMASLLMVGCVPKSEPLKNESSEYVMLLPAGSQTKKENTYSVKDIRQHIYQLENIDDFSNLKNTKPVEAGGLQYEIVSVEDDSDFDEFTITLRVTNQTEKEVELAPIGVINGFYNTDLFGYGKIAAKQSEELEIPLTYTDLFYMGAKGIYSFGVMIFDAVGTEDRLIPLYEAANKPEEDLGVTVSGAVLVDEANVKVIARGLDLRRSGVALKLPIMLYQKQGEATSIRDLELEVNGTNLGSSTIYTSALTKNMHTAYYFINDDEAFFKALKKEGLQTIHLKGTVETASGEYAIDREFKFQ